MDHPKVIGGKEMVSIPDVSTRRVIARIDTGAKSSSIHCNKVWFEKFDGKPVLCAYLLRKTTHVTRFAQFRTRKVKSSNGHIQKRYSVMLQVKFDGKMIHTEFTLSNRSSMKYSVLLGRRFLRNRYIVDVSQNFVVSPPTLKK